MSVPMIFSREKKYAKLIGPLPKMKFRVRTKDGVSSGGDSGALSRKTNSVRNPGELSKAWL